MTAPSHQKDPINTMIDLTKDLVIILDLSANDCHLECLQACKNALQVNPEEAYSYKTLGKSLLAFEQFKKGL